MRNEILSKSTTKLAIEGIIDFFILIVLSVVDFINDETIVVTMSLGVLVFTFFDFILLTSSLNKLRADNYSFKLAYAWIFISIILFVCTYMIETLGEYFDNLTLVKIAEYSELLVQVSDVIMAISIIDGLTISLIKSGEVDLSLKAKKVKLPYSILIMLPSSIAFVIDILGSMGVNTEIFNTIPIYLKGVCYLIGYFPYLAFLFKVADFYENQISY